MLAMVVVTGLSVVVVEKTTGVVVPVTSFLKKGFGVDGSRNPDESVDDSGASEVVVVGSVVVVVVVLVVVDLVVVGVVDVVGSAVVRSTSGKESNV